MGWAYGGQCYSLKAEALDAAGAASFPRVRDSGGCLQMLSAVRSGDQLIVTTQSPECPAVPSPMAFEPAFVECDPLQWTSAPWLSVADAGLVSIAILGVWGIAWAARAAIKAVSVADSVPD